MYSYVEVSSKTDHDGRCSKGQAEEHEERNDLVSRFDIRQTQTAVMTAETPADRFENVRPLQEIHADHR